MHQHVLPVVPAVAVRAPVVRAVPVVRLRPVVERPAVSLAVQEVAAAVAVVPRRAPSAALMAVPLVDGSPSAQSGRSGRSSKLP